MISQHINILTLPYEFLGSGVFDENEPPKDPSYTLSEN